MSPSQNPWEELGGLASLLCEGQIMPQEAARIEELARSSPETMRYLLHYLQLHGELYWEHAVTLRDRPPAGLARIADTETPRRGDAGTTASATTGTITNYSQVNSYDLTPPRTYGVEFHYKF